MTENPQKENGHVDIANELVEALCRTNISPHEGRVLWSVLRKTYGWQKKSDWIALSQIAELTGMHKAHISRAKRKLLERRIVTQTGNKLSFNKFYSQWRELPKQVTVTQTGKAVTQTGKAVTQTGNPSLPKQAHTKETTTKDTYTKDTGSVASATPAEQAVAFFENTELQQKALEFFTASGASADHVRREITKFIAYWTEPTHGGRKVRWQLQKTFDVKRRLVTWLARSQEPKRSAQVFNADI